MKNHPFFSVIIPTYNSGKYLERALTSVISQTFDSYEIIIVDNHSIDETDEIISSFKACNISKYKVKNEGIIAISRNKGISKSKGDWIAFLDSDDVWAPNKLKEVYDSICNNTDCILFSHNEFHFHDNVKKKILHHGPASDKMFEKLLFSGNCLSTSAVCIKKEVALLTNGFSENLDFVTVEDYEFWIRLSKEGKFYFIDNVLGEWHTHNTNYSNNSIIHCKALLSVVQFHLNKLPSKKLKNKLLHLYTLSKNYTIASRIVYRERNFSLSLKFIKKALFKNPFYFKAWAMLILSLLRIKY